MRPVLPTLRLILPAALMLVLVACGSGGEPGASSSSESAPPPAAESAGRESSAPSPSADPGEQPRAAASGSCAVNVTGDLATSWEGSGGSSAVASDYWYTRDELEQAAEFLGGMKEGEPVFSFLVINCVSSRTSQKVSLLPAVRNSLDDIPYEPARYTIAVRGQSQPGQFTSIFVVDDAAVFSVSSPGELTITRFDETGIAGTFRFAATELVGPREIEVSGSFDFACTGRSLCRR